MDERMFAESVMSFAWQHLPQDTLCVDGIAVSVVKRGVRDSEGAPLFRGAEFVIGGRTYVGDVAIAENSSDWSYARRNCDPAYDGVVLLVVGENDQVVRRLDNSQVYCAQMTLPAHISSRLRLLAEGSPDYACGRIVAKEFGDVERKGHLARLMIDRLERKHNDIMKIYRSCGESWHETFHIMLFRTMGLGSNKEVYMSLAQNLPYSKLCRERGDTEAVEAMLFGVAGLLDRRVFDDYKSRLTDKFEALKEKHSLQVLDYCCWTERGVRPYNFVPKRIAQIAKLIDSGDFTFDNVVACENVKHLRRLFDIELSHYWRRSFSFGVRGPMSKKGVGDMTTDIILINLAVPVMFAYGRHSGDEAMEERALDLLYEIEAEENRYTVGWKKSGVKCADAFESQALIQLTTEYCAKNRCTECFVGIKVLKNI